MGLLGGLIGEKGFGKFLGITFLGLFFLYILISGIIVSIQNHDINVGLKSVGNEMLNPLKTAQENANLIQKNENISLLQSIWKYFGFWANLYKIYLWIWVFYLILNITMGKAVPGFNKFVFAIILFYIVEVLYCIAILKTNAMYPFIATKDIFNVFVYFFNKINIKK